MAIPRQSVQNVGLMLQALFKSLAEQKDRELADQQYGSAITGATRTSYNPTPSNIQQGRGFGDVMRRGTIEAQPRGAGGPMGQRDVSANPYARTDSLDNNALMQSLAQMFGQTQNPALQSNISRYFQGQKALQGLEPEYRVGGGAEAGYFQYDPRNPAKSMQQLTPPRPQSQPGMTPYQKESLKQRKDEFEWNKNKPAGSTSAIELRIRTLEDDIEKAEREAQEAELKMSALESGVDPILKYDRSNPTKSSGYQMYTVLGSNRLANLKKVEKKRKELEALQAGASLNRPVGAPKGAGKNSAPMEYDYVPGKGLVPRAR